MSIPSLLRQNQPPKCSVRKGVFRNFSKFTGKHMCQSLIFIKLQVSGHRCFPVNFAKSLRTPFSQNTSGRRPLLLYIKIIIFSRILGMLGMHITFTYHFSWAHTYNQMVLKFVYYELVQQTLKEQA